MPLEGFDDVELPDDIPQRGGWEKSGNGGITKVIDYAAVEGAASIGCTRDEIAAVIGVAPSTLYLRIDQDPQMREAIERGSNKGKATLRRMQWKGAQDGNATMLVWLGKQMLGQKDMLRQEHTGEDGAPISYVIRAPLPAENANEWLKLHGPKDE
jgi:hypothetical protein